MPRGPVETGGPACLIVHPGAKQWTGKPSLVKPLSGGQRRQSLQHERSNHEAVAQAILFCEESVQVHKPPHRPFENPGVTEHRVPV